PSRKAGRKALIALVFLAAIRFHSAESKETILPTPHAPVPLLPADPARDPEGSGGRLPPADVARGPHPPRDRRDLRLAAARLSRAQEDRADRARGAGPRGCHRALDAHAATCRSLARERSLRRLRPGNVAHQGPPRTRHALRAHQRGDDHRDIPRLHSLLSRVAEDPLSHPV